MASITLKGNPFSTSGELPSAGAAPDFSLLSASLQRVSLSEYAGKKVMLNIFPSLDTPVCASSVRHFNEAASGLDNVAILNISEDLVFAQKRFCGAEGIENSETLSAFKSSFAKDYGVEILDGPLAGLCARAVVVLNDEGEIVYSELVPEIAQEPNYDAALAALG